LGAESIWPAHFSTASLAIVNPHFVYYCFQPTQSRGELFVPKRSAGIMMFRRTQGDLEVFLVHPGGPFWVKKDLGAWTIPKGEYADDEQPLAAALREFQEETGFPISGPFHELGTIRQASGKLVSAWAVKGDCDPAKLVSNFCQVEWPPRSRRLIRIPEIDRGAWYSIPEARKRILVTQTPLLDALVRSQTGLQSDRKEVRPASQGTHATAGPRVSSS
jgi:predicted NUDIX family NTP pyrophosphohydrolase